jgi:hypothetical protein
MRIRFAVAAAGLAAVVMLPVIASAQRDQRHNHPAEPSATVGFGVFPAEKLGPPPCIQENVPNGPVIGGPADPCAYKIHHLVPEEVTIRKGGEVTFHVHGGGHGMAIYKVSRNTTRDEVGQFLCPGDDPSTIGTPEAHDCNGTTANGTANANANHVIPDGRGDVVIVSGFGGPNHPNNRVWYEPGRFMSVGGNQFINGGTTAANGQLITYQFLKNGRYLIICINRSHFLNDWMFGFVNVVGRNNDVDDED